MRRPRRRALPRPSLPAVPRRVLVAVPTLLVVLVGGWFLIRNSPLTAVHHVRISGVSGSQADQVRQAIEDAARTENTLNVDAAKIADAARQFPIVAGVSVSAHPLHTLDVVVHEHVPVAALVNGSRRVAVASDGTILEGTLTRGLPEVPLGTPPGGRTVSEPRARGMVALLAAAPRALLSHVSGVELGSHGLVAHLSDGPDLYFGAARRLAAKWMAAARVLADYSSRGAAYIDVRVPERPAAGGMPTDPASASTADPATASPLATAAAAATTAAAADPSAAPAATTTTTATTPAATTPTQVNPQVQVQPTR